MTENQYLQLLMQHESKLRAYGYTILPNWTRLDDAMQEAFLLIWERREQLASPDEFVPWARAIVRFKCLSQVQQVQKERKMVNEKVLELIASEEGDAASDFRFVAMPALRQCMEKFPQHSRELLLAPYGKGANVMELAAAKKTTANALYKILGRLRKKLFLCVNQQLELQA